MVYKCKLWTDVLLVGDCTGIRRLTVVKIKCLTVANCEGLCVELQTVRDSVQNCKL